MLVQFSWPALTSWLHFLGPYFWTSHLHLIVHTMSPLQGSFNLTFLPLQMCTLKVSILQSLWSRHLLQLQLMLGQFVRMRTVKSCAVLFSGTHLATSCCCSGIKDHQERTPSLWFMSTKIWINWVEITEDKRRRGENHHLCPQIPSLKYVFVKGSDWVCVCVCVKESWCR